MTLKIKLVWLLFPITLPLLVLRGILAGITAVLIAPISIISLFPNKDINEAWGWATKYTTLLYEAKHVRSKTAGEGVTMAAYRRIRVSPSLLGRISGFQPSKSYHIQTWQFDYDYDYNPNPQLREAGWRYSDGCRVPLSIKKAVLAAEKRDAYRLNEQKSIEQKKELIQTMTTMDSQLPGS